MTRRLLSFAAAGLVGVSGVARGSSEARPAAELQAAIAAAAPGGVVTVTPGVHLGPVVVDRAIVLEGRPGAVIQAPLHGDAIRITAAHAVVRGLTVRGGGKSLEDQNAAISVFAPDATIADNVLDDVLFGVCLNAAPRTIVRGNRIRGMPLDLGRRGDAIRLWSSDDVAIEGNEVAGARDVVIWYCKRVALRHNRIEHGRYGMHFMYAEGAVLEENRLEDNSVGAYLMYSRDLTLTGNVFARNRGPSGFGLGLKDVDAVRARANRFVGNRVGIYIDNSPWSVSVVDAFDGNLLAFNDVGVEFLPAVRRNRFSGNAFIDNVEHVALQGGGQLVGNDFTVAGRGNFWSDYAGYDLGKDGVGDVPYRAESLFENLMDRERGLRLFLFSPAQQAIELAARSLPVIKPRPKIEDEAPLLAPPSLAAIPVAPSARWPFAALASLLGLASVLALRVASAREETKRAGEGRTDGARAGEAVAAATSAPLLRIAGLTKRFGKLTALDAVDLEIAPGEAVALWGRNGAGKTTAIRCVLGLYRFAGTLEVAGCDVRRNGKDARRQLGYVPQELAFHDDPTMRETLLFYARLKRVPTSRVEDVLAEVDMHEHADKRIRELSGGMKQRVALAAALLSDPPMLVLDEMTSNLDQEGRAGFLRLLARLRRRGKTILFASHRLDELRLLADRVVVLDRGRVRAVCRPDDLPALLDLRALLKLRVAASPDTAADVLRRGGFAPSTNGGGELRVEVPVDRKVEVFRMLERESVIVTDFELETAGPLPSAGPTGVEEV